MCIYIIKSSMVKNYCLDSEYGGSDAVEEEYERVCPGRAGGLLGSFSHEGERDVIWGVIGRDESGVLA